MDKVIIACENGFKLMEGLGLKCVFIDFVVHRSTLNRPKIKIMRSGGQISEYVAK